MVELIIEDGSGVAAANSYTDVETLITYAENRGITLVTGSPIDEEQIAIMAINAMDYIEALKNKWKGNRATTTQRLSWPRDDVYVNGEELADDAIPQDLIDAECELVLQISKGVDLMPTVAISDAFVKREKIGPIETEFSEAVRLSASQLPDMPKVDALLEDLLNYSFGRLRSKRI